MGGTSSMHGRKKECITKVQLENQKEWDQPRYRWEDNIKIDVQGIGWGAMDWVQNRDHCLLWTLQWTSGFHKMLGNSRVAERCLPKKDSAPSSLVTWNQFLVNTLLDTFLLLQQMRGLTAPSEEFYWKCLIWKKNKTSHNLLYRSNRIERWTTLHQTLKLHTTITFVNIVLQRIFHTKYVGIFMMYIYTKFLMPSSNGSSIITIKLRSKYRFCKVTMSFYIIQKPYLNKNIY
jgi:hypothetical protein